MVPEYSAHRNFTVKSLRWRQASKKIKRRLIKEFFAHSRRPTYSIRSSYPPLNIFRRFLRKFHNRSQPEFPERAPCSHMATPIPIRCFSVCHLVDVFLIILKAPPELAMNEMDPPVSKRQHHPYHPLWRRASIGGHSF